MNNYCKSLLVFLVSCFFIFPFLNAQIVYKGVVRTDKSWSQLMQDPTVNFYDVQATFNDWYEKTKPKKGIKPYKRWEAFMEPRVYPTGERPDPSIVINELEKFKKENPTESTNGNWSFLGPTVINGSIPNGPYQSPGGNGRINCIVFDPGYNGTTNQILWAGTPSGGLWKTENNGTTWVSTAMDLSSIGVSHIVIDPANSNNMWIATGDGEVGDTYSNGVMRSFDGGVNWAVTSFTALPSNYYRVRRLLADPSNILIQIAFCNGITYRTTDGWVTRNTVASLGANIIDDAEYMPGTNGATVYASLTTGGAAQLWRSVDHGATFALCASGLPAAGVERIAIAVSNAAPNNVWALVGRSLDQGLMGVYRSTTGLGTAFATLTGTSPNLLGWNADFSDAGGQAFFDLSIQVNPTNANEVFVGGVNLAKSIDGGTNWTCSAYWLRGAPGYQYAHADHHAIEYAPNGWIFNGNDGGVFLSKDNGTTWYDISNNLGIAQIARMGLSSTNKDLILTGMQDNGSNKFANGKWEVIRGGDGCEQIVDPTNNNIIFSSYVGGVVYRSADAGVTWATVLNSGGGWITPYIMDPVNHNNMYSASYPSFRKSTNNGVTWANAGAYNPAVAGTYPNWLTIGTTNPAVLFCSNQAQIWKSTNSATSWANGIGDLAVTAAISCIEVSPDDITHVTVTLSGYNAAQKVYHSTNGGTNWSNITSNLPNSPVNVVVYERGNVNRRVYVGTDIGVYYKDDTQPNWTLFDAGLPTVSVHDMEIFYGATYCDHRLRIATYGRSVWESDLVGGGTIAYTSSNTTQTNTNFVNKGDVSQEIVGVKITMSNCGDPLVVTDFQFNTTGCTNALTDISNARLYYTGAVPSFEPIQQFGNVIANPNGTFTITGSRNLVGGDNYFWLTYDIRPTATSNNFVDAECTQITINGVNRIPSTTAPAGNRQIKNSTIIGPGTEISYNYGPIYRLSAGSTADYSRFIYLFTQAELTTAGLTNGSVINTLAWIKSNSASTLGNANFRIYLKNSALTFLTSPTVWATAIGTMTLVYNSATQTVPFAAGWNTFDITDFTYTGGALEVAVEWDISGVAGNPTTGPFYWTYSNMPALYTLGGAGTSFPANVVSATYGGNVRPNMQMTFTAPLAGPINVSGAHALSNGDYPTVKDAFDAINAQVQTGFNIVIKVNGNSTETTTATLNAGTWASITMYPTVAGLSISSNNSTGNGHLIDLRGVTSMTIDGRVNLAGAASLTLTHTGTDNTSRNIRFIESAQNNTIRYINFRGACPSSGAGMVFFSTSTAGTGNDNNIIEYCNFTNSGVRPLHVIGSDGTATRENSGNIIRNNNFYDFLNPANNSRAIYLSLNTTDWTITGNSFYETTALAPSAAVAYQPIYISNTGNNYSITGNYIGGSAPLCAGTFTKTNTQGTVFNGIYLNVGNVTASNIQGNTISNINWSNSGNPSWMGIYINGGSVNVGTTSANIIGSGTGINSIVITNTATNGTIYGIYSSSIGTLSIQNNNIGSLSTTGVAATGYVFYGIFTSGAAGNYNINANTIGSTTTANSIAIGTNGITTAVTQFSGIYNTASGTISITGNTVQNCSSFGSGASLYYGIYNTNGSGTININSNNLIGGLLSGSSDFRCIHNGSGAATVNINSNVIRNNTKSSGSGNFYCISNSGAVTTAININSNQLGNASGGLISFSAASSGNLYGIHNNNGTGTCALSIIGNNFQGITHTIASTSPHYYIYNLANTLSQDISNNTFTSLNVNTSGPLSFIQNSVNLPAAGTQTISGNSVITSFNKGSVWPLGNIVYCIVSNGSSLAGATVNWSNNNFSNMTFDGNTAVRGLHNTDGGAGVNKTFNGNTFSNWSGGTGGFYAIYINNGGSIIISNNIITGFSGYNSKYGIEMGFAGTSSTISGNTIGTFTCTDGPEIVGIISAAPNGFILKNKIYDLSNSRPDGAGSVHGIRITQGNHTVSNNRIGDLRTTTANAANPLIGINLLSTTAASTINIYYNTIYLNATSTGVNFGSTCIFHTANATATTAALNMRNNIFVNLSTPRGTGLTTAFRRSAVTLANYANTSNNNLFYAGPSGANNLIYYDGTNSDQTLPAFKARVTPADLLSVTENPTFLSIVGTNPNFLKVSTVVPTQIESGAVNIATFTDDFDNDIRQGNAGYVGTGTAPDIGSDEFEGIPPIAGPINVSAAHALSNGNYATLKDAFDAINAQVQTGFNIVIKVNGSTVETTTATLNAGTWASITMYPTVAGLSISSNNSTGNGHLIDLRGVTNMTIDGRVNVAGAADLALVHTGTDNTSRNIRFIESAQNNTIRYVNFRGACPSSGAGMVFFSTSTVGTGNDNNTLDNCNFTNSGVRPLNAIGSDGTATRENSGNIISNNKFYDLFNPGFGSKGIYLSSNTTDWTISGNSFYETTSFAPTAAVTYYGIYISNTGGNYTISGNYIGGSGPSCTGTFTKTNSQNNIFYGIWLSVGSTPVCNIQGNTIQNFSWSNLLNANWAGIYCSSGIVNIGTTIPNVVGSSTGNGSITITNTTSTGAIYGIFASTATPNTSNIQNNQIGSYTLGGAAGIIYNFYGINTSGTGNFNISSNTIGSTTTANSITVGAIGVSTAAQTYAGIINSASGIVSITGNTIQNCISAGTGASVLYGVLNSGGTVTLNINTNNFIALTHYGTSSFNCVSNIAATPTVNINNNILRNLVINSNCLFYGLFNSAANATAININNNQFGNTSGGFVTYPLAAAGSLYAVGNSGGTGTCAVSVSGNDIRGINHTVLGSTAHTYIYNSANTLSCNISNNTFTDLNVNTSGAVTFIQNTSSMGATSIQTVNNNSVVNAFNKTGSGGGVTCYTGGGSFAGATITHSGNNFSNITVDGTSGIIGWRNTNNYGTNITGNTFSNWTSGNGFSYGIIISAGGASNFNTYSNNTISNFSGSGGFFGIQVVGAGNFGTITSNTINSIYTTGGQIVGITSQLGTTTGGTISRNKIYDLSYNTLYGIWIVSSTPGGSTHNIINNRIADLKPVPGGSSTLIYGIFIQNAVPLGKMNVFYNSVYLNASTTGATLGTIGLLHVYDATATTSELELRNNIIVNVSTPKGAGRTIAFQRTAATNLNNYNISSNNNLLYAGTPGANNLIYSDGTNFDQTLLAFKTRVTPREIFSVTELPPFLSTLGSNPDFLKIDPVTPTQAESGASNIATYIDDFEGDIRQGNPGYAGTGTQPDIGADEFDGLRIDTWVGTVSEDFNTANNWRCKVVPLSGSNIVFDVRPFNHCKLDMDRTINNLTNAQSTYDMFPNSRKITIQGSLIFSGGAQIDDQTAPSKVEFNGSVAQVMPAGCFVNNTVNDIIINNSNGVSMGGVGNITINGTLTLTSGILTTGANIMDLSTLGTIVETPIAPTSYVLGNLRSTRNIGGAVNQTFGGIGLEINEPGALNSTVATRVTGTQLNGNAPCCNLNLSIRRYFDIVPTINAGLNANMTFKYFDWEIAGYTEANLKLYKAPLPYLPNTWVEQLSAVVNPPNNWLTQSGITSFSRWTAADLNNPLPVQLLNFEAFRNGDKIDLGWTTASEVNNDFFTLEKSPDTKNWNILGFVDGAGNSNQPLKYEFFDYNPLMGIQYYRLKQTDFNGKYTNSGIVNVNFLLENNNEICLYPNPTEGEFNLYVSGETDKFIKIRLINAMGQLIWEKDIMAGIKQVFNIEDQPNGLYYLEVKNDQNIERFKLVKD